MLAELREWFVVSLRVPNHKFIIVASRCEESVVEETPPESADFLLVRLELSVVVFVVSDVSDQDGSISRGSGQLVSVPTAGSDAVGVALEGADHLGLLHVPDLHGAGCEADADVRALLTPSDTRDEFVLLLDGQALREGGAGVPDVELFGEGHGQHVRAAPVDQVQVEVVAQVLRVQHFVGRALDLALGAVLGGAETFRLLG